MSLYGVPELIRALSPGERLMGLDLGSRRIGVAISDPGLRVATPIGFIERSKFRADMSSLARFAADRGVGGFVVGWPIMLDGAVGSAAQSARDYALNMVEQNRAFGLADRVALWDERLSSAAVNRMLISEGDVSRRRRTKLVDALAAAYILQGALDSATTP